IGGSARLLDFCLQFCKLGPPRQGMLEVIKRTPEVLPEQALLSRKLPYAAAIRRQSKKLEGRLLAYLQPGVSQGIQHINVVWIQTACSFKLLYRHVVVCLTAVCISKPGVRDWVRCFNPHSFLQFRNGCIWI